mgnify:CR=1 FL=1
MHDATKYQQRLATLGYLAADQVDGVFGPISLDAFNHYRATRGLPPINTTTLDELESVLFPKPPKPVSTNPLAILWALLPVFTKGTAMTSEQLQGVARTILAAALPYAIAKGWIPAGSADLVVSAGVAVLVAVWSVLSKPKKA